MEGAMLWKNLNSSAGISNTFNSWTLWEKLAGVNSLHDFDGVREHVQTPGRYDGKSVRDGCGGFAALRRYGMSICASHRCLQNVRVQALCLNELHGREGCRCCGV